MFSWAIDQGEAPMISRRDFLAGSVLATGSLAARELFAVPFAANGELKALANIALNAARKLGASYADIRICRYRSHNVSVRTSPDRSGTVNTVPGVSNSESYGFGIRVIAKNTWGFAASHRVEKDEIGRVAAEAVQVAKANSIVRKTPVQLAPVPAYKDATWRTPLKKDPFDVPIKEKLDFLIAINEEVRKVHKVFSVISSMSFRSEQKYFA